MPTAGTPSNTLICQQTGQSVPFIAPATPEDLPAIVALRAAEGWAIHDWLLGLVCRWEGGRLFVVRPDPAPAASAESASPHLIAATSAVAYSKVGVVGNVIVHSAYRRQGLGKQLMRAAIDWLAGHGVQAVELDATPEGRPLYAQLGFLGIEPSWVLWAPLDRVDRDRIRGLAGAMGISPLRAGGLGAVAALDRQAFGGDRLGLLAGMLQLSDTRAYVTRVPGAAAAGYLIARPLEPPRAGLHLGPWVAQTPAIAAALLAAALPAAEPSPTPHGYGRPHLQAFIPGASRAARALYAALDLPLIEDDLRMRLDLPQPNATQSAAEPSNATRPDWIYAMLAPMVG
jgi:GNAT superfamily N-acetyltransferase